MRNHRTVCWNTREALIAKADFHIFFPQPIHIHYHDIRRPPCGAGLRDTLISHPPICWASPCPFVPPPYYHNKKHWKCSRCCPVLLCLLHCFHFWLRAPSERPKEEEKRKRKRKRERERERRERERRERERRERERRERERREREKDKEEKENRRNSKDESVLPRPLPPP